MGSSAIAKIAGVFDDQDEQDGKDAVPQTEEQKFVQKLYEKVHTQSDMVQQQMTLNIITEIKQRRRQDADPDDLQTCCRIWRKRFLPLKWVSLSLLLILPIFTVPNWCIEANLYQQDGDCDPDNFPNSGFFKLPPAMSTALNVCAYVFLSIFIIMRLFLKKRSKGSIIRSVAMFGMMMVATGDIIWVSLDSHRATSWLVPIFNVMLLIFFIRAIREVWIQFSMVMVRSVPVFVIIIAYFVLFVMIGFILFANNDYDSSFSTINSSMYTVFVLFTVSNYPDIELPYFMEARLSMIYFWTFLLIGIFLLSNLLLAQIFINYKTLIDEKLKRYEKDVDLYFKEIFDAITGNDKIDEELARLEAAEQTEETKVAIENLPKKVESITSEQFKEVLGGEEVVGGDKRL